MTDQPNAFSKVWRSAQLFIGFHRDQNGIKRDVAKVWSPKNASATIHSDPTEQEAFVVVRRQMSRTPRTCRSNCVRIRSSCAEIPGSDGTALSQMRRG